MEFKLLSIREAFAKLIGNPSISEAIAKELDTALLADESSVGAKLAEHTNQGEEHETKPDVVVAVPVAVVTIVPTEIVADETPNTHTALEAVLLELKGIRSGMAALKAENATLKAENESLDLVKQAASPRGVFSAGENGTGKVQIGRNKNAEKDEAELTEFKRLAETYPTLMSDLVTL